MKKIFASLALLPSLGMGGQYTVPTFRAGPNTITTVPMTIDGSIHGQTSNGSGSSTTAAVTIGTPTAGDGIICEVSFSHSSTFVSVADNVNAGNYSAGMAATLIIFSQQCCGQPYDYHLDLFDYFVMVVYRLPGGKAKFGRNALRRFYVHAATERDHCEPDNRQRDYAFL